MHVSDWQMGGHRQCYRAWGYATHECGNCTGDLVCTLVGRRTAEREQSGCVPGGCASGGSWNGKEEHRLCFALGRAGPEVGNERA